VQDRGERGGRRAPVERRGALDREPQGRPQPPQVGGRTTAAAHHLLGRDVRQRPEGRGGDGEGPLGVLQRGDAEVGQLGGRARRHHHVGRLDVVVDDARAVGRRQRGEQVQADVGRRRRGQRPVPRDQVAQGRRVDQLHHQEQPSGRVHHVVQGDHAGVVEPGRGPGLPQGPLADRRLLAVGQAGRQRHLLDRHRPVQQGVLGPPHHAHAATAEHRPEGVTAGDQPPVGAGCHDARKYGRNTR
jgi:hypothetical protein